MLANRACFELDKGCWSDAVGSATLVLGRPWVSTMPRTLALHSPRAHPRQARRPDRPPTHRRSARAEPTGELMRITPVAIAEAEAAWLIGDTAGARGATEQALALAVNVEASGDIAQLQAWRKRAGVIEPPHELAADGPNRLGLGGQYEAAAAALAKTGTTLRGRTRHRRRWKRGRASPLTRAAH